MAKPLSGLKACELSSCHHSFQALLLLLPGRYWLSSSRHLHQPNDTVGQWHTQEPVVKSYQQSISQDQLATPLHWFCTSQSPESSSDMLFFLGHSLYEEIMMRFFLTYCDLLFQSRVAGLDNYRCLERSHSGLLALIPLLQTCCWTIFPILPFEQQCKHVSYSSLDTCANTPCSSGYVPPSAPPKLWLHCSTSHPLTYGCTEMSKQLGKE